ncbi:MAG: hypothetical protein ACR2KE_08020 [Candidatus Nanopelagicales bacterium]
MTRAPRFLSVFASLAIAASALVAAGTPAQAQGIGSGRAVVRIDAPSATVIKVGKHSYRMLLPEGATGQWMGERPNAAGTRVTRVGDLTAAKLAKRWTKFRYSIAPVYTTLTWDDGSHIPGAALVMLSPPRVTDKGVRFDFTSRADLPRTMSNVSLHVSRAARAGDGARSSGAPQSAVVTGTMTVGISFDSTGRVLGRIYSAPSTNCWGGSSGSKVGSSTSVGSGTCGGIPYADYETIPPAFGISLDSVRNEVFFNLNVTPPGQASYQYAQIFSW